MLTRKKARVISEESTDSDKIHTSHKDTYDRTNKVDSYVAKIEVTANGIDLD